MSYSVIGLGEILWDLLPTGKQMGGAPANFAFHAQSLGARSRVISRVGSDALGVELLRRLQTLGLPISDVQLDPAAPTGTVTVKLADDGQPAFTIHEGVAWDRLAVAGSAVLAMGEADAVAFGTLAQRCEPSRATIHALLGSARPGALRILDLNLRQTYFSEDIIKMSLGLASVVKFNDGELPALAPMFHLRGTVREQLEQLAGQYQLKLVCLTRGAHGSLLYSEGKWADDPGAPVVVKDTVGAGDAFTAALAMGMLRGKSLEAINKHANEVARFVCSREGATPLLPDALRQPD